MNPSVLLTDQQVQEFLIKGYLVLQPSSLDATFHSTILTEVSSIFEKEGNLGNNILPRIPQLQCVFDDPVIRGALESLLGTNYIMQPHRHPHVTKPGCEDQTWHKDSYFAYYKVLRHHQLRYAMVMYYPQETTIDMGPTAIQPRTQYDIQVSQTPQEEIRMVCSAGTVALIHYDLVHKGTANRTENTPRFMFKFQFNRLEEPTRPTWNHNPSNTVYNAPDTGLLQPIATHVWNWLLGNTNAALPRSPVVDEKIVQQWETQLDSPDGRMRLGAAYNLALNGAYPLLIKRLYHQEENFRLEAAYALTACRSNQESIDALQTVLQKEGHSEQQASCIAFIFSEMGPKALSALPLLTQVLQTSDSWLVKRYCCEALGNIHPHEPQDVNLAVKSLTNVLADGNQESDPHEASHVRFTAALSLAKLGPKAVEAIPTLKDALYLDPNRYVNGNSLLALERIRTNEALKIVLNYLKIARWCPKTTADSLF